VSIILAIAAAAVYGCGVALQQSAAAEVPDAEAFHPGLLVRLARRPRWRLGLLADIVGFGLQGAALRRGSLVVVQPILTLALVFALGIAASLNRTRVQKADWMAIVVVLAGLTIFGVGAEPTDTSLGVASPTAWFACTFLVIAGTAILAVVALATTGAKRAVLLAIAAGGGEAFMAAVTKAWVGHLDEGWGHSLNSWEPYAVAVTGIGVMLVVQSAYQAGHPTLSLPIITVVDPIVGAVIGAALFHEHLRLGGGRAVLVMIAIALMTLGIRRLARSPSLMGDGTAADLGVTG
jgi:drug/metabolite transporter (DMT)-like permease